MGGMEEGGMTQHNDHRPADESLETRYYTYFEFFKLITIGCKKEEERRNTYLLGKCISDHDADLYGVPIDAAEDI